MSEIYPKPSITCDVIVFDRRANKLLLIKRKKNPYKDYWAFCGGFFNPIDHNGEKQDVSLKAAALRELKEETNIDGDMKNLRFLTIQDAPDRDPRGRTITAVYVYTLWDGIEGLNVKAQDDAVEAEWFGIGKLMSGEIPLAFDHFDELKKFVGGTTYI